jgi:hypothetical protein
LRPKNISDFQIWERAKKEIGTWQRKDPNIRSLQMFTFFLTSKLRSPFHSHEALEKGNASKKFLFLMAFTLQKLFFLKHFPPMLGKEGFFFFFLGMSTQEEKVVSTIYASFITYTILITP